MIKSNFIEKIREEIINACIKLTSLNLLQNSSGNISLRYKQGFLITPSAIEYENIKPEDICFIEISSKSPNIKRLDLKNHKKPSSEWKLHKAIYEKRSDVNCIIHTHSTFATSLAICNKPIPAIHYMIALFKTHIIKCAPYASFGSKKLSQNAVEALGEAKACLLANHGAIHVGKDMAETIMLTIELEELAKQYYIANSFGDVKILSNDEIQKNIKNFSDYKKID